MGRKCLHNVNRAKRSSFCTSGFHSRAALSERGASVSLGLGSSCYWLVVEGFDALNQPALLPSCLIPTHTRLFRFFKKYILLTGGLIRMVIPCAVILLGPGPVCTDLAGWPTSRILSIMISRTIHCSQAPCQQNNSPCLDSSRRHIQDAKQTSSAGLS